jgi:hypothetical protein
MIQPYEQIAKEFAEHPVRVAEVALEHFVSCPLPTRRWSIPAYAVYTCPAARIPGEPLELDPPDSWLAIGAEDGTLLAYALVSVVPFADGLSEEPVTVQPVGRSLAAVREDRRRLGELMTEAAPAFFAGEGGDPAVRSDLAEMLSQVLPAAALPWDEGLAPDFFEWVRRP